jgi:hypothetical protein
MCDDVVDDIKDAIDDTLDFFEDVLDETLDFFLGWLVPDIPDLPDLDSLLNGDGVLVNKRNSNSPLPVLYGTRRIGGNIVFLGTSSDNQFLYVVIAMCEGQVARFTELYIDDILYATYTGSDSSYGTAQTISSLGSTSLLEPTNTSNLSIETDHPVYSAIQESLITSDLGSAIDEVSDEVNYLTNFAFFNGHDDGLIAHQLTGMSDLDNLGWSSSHNGKGIAHAVFKFKYDSDAFNGIPKINFVIRGKQILTDLSGTSYAYSANPALILYDYLTSTRYGKGLSASDINTTAFTTAAGICNTSVTPFTGASTEALFECHTALGNKTKLIDNVKKILSSMRAFFTFSGGLYTIKVEGTGSSVLSITEDMIISGIQVQGETKQKRYNRVIARFDNSEKNFQPDEVIYPPSDETNVGADFKYATMLANDNNEELHFEMSMPCTVSPYQAEDMAELVLKRSRAGLQISFLATSEAQELAIGDIFQVTHSGMGFSTSNFICVGLSLQNNGNVSIKGLEYSADAYTYNTKLQTASQPTTFLPSPKTVNAPVIASIFSEAVNVTEGNLNVIMTVGLRNTPDFFVDKYEVVYKKSTASFYKSAGISSSIVREIPVESGVTYNVKARAINALGYKSAYVAQDHYVVGFSNPPANVANFSIDFQDEIAVLKWDPSTDLDLAYYHIRYSPNADDSYPNSIVLVDKVSPPANSVIVPAKAGVYFIKAFDLLGHESLTAGSVIGTVTEFAGQNLATTITEETSFAGTKSQVVVEDNALILAGDAVTLFDAVSGDFDDRVGFFDEVDGFESTGTYTFANQISLGAKYQGRVSSFLNVDQLDRVSSFDGHAGLFDSAQGLFDSAGASPNMDAKLFISTSDDNSTYTAFTPFQDGNYEFRFAKFQLKLTSAVSSQSPKVNNAQVRLFMADRTDTGSNIASGAGTKAVTFNKAFFAEPSVVILAQNAAQNIQTTITNKSATGFSVTFTNAGGSAQDITFDYVANGQGRAI